MTARPAFVLLEDGAWFAGTTARPLDPAFGEVVFTTNITGYQETFTDPSLKNEGDCVSFVATGGQ